MFSCCSISQALMSALLGRPMHCQQMNCALRMPSCWSVTIAIRLLWIHLDRPQSLLWMNTMIAKLPKPGEHLSSWARKDYCSTMNNLTNIFLGVAETNLLFRLIIAKSFGWWNKKKNTDLIFALNNVELRIIVQFVFVRNHQQWLHSGLWLLTEKKSFKLC